MAARPLFPGRCCPGLIEGRSGRRGAVHISPSFPGRCCPGLIEGSWTRRGISANSSFRGVVAPASLKGQERRDREHRGDAFPGRCCPGLIEGTQATTVTIDTPLGFRGVVAPASLKGVINPQGWGEPSSFRGVVAPASLKGDRAPQLRRFQVTVSGALLPRPH